MATDSTSKPTIVIVPGGWHTPAHYEIFASALQDQGFPTVTVALPSVGSENPEAESLQKDAEAIRQVILSVLTKSNAIVVAHSWGGELAGTALEGLGKPSTESDQRGRVVGLVYISAYMGLGLTDLPWLSVGSNEAPGTWGVNSPIDVFYNDVEIGLAKDLASKLKPHAISAFDPTNTRLGWSEPAFEGRRIYVMGTDDHAVPAAFWESILEKSASNGWKWDMRKLKGAGHSPMISRTEDVVDIIKEAATKWT